MVVIMVDFLAALISAMTISMNIMAPVIVAAKNHDIGFRGCHINRASTATIHISNTTGKDNHRYHGKHGRAAAEIKPPHVAS
jgi:hypothetical protein